jgi:putative PEP-CTERM system TPR-repeat lipoprotein
MGQFMGTCFRHGLLILVACVIWGCDTGISDEKYLENASKYEQEGNNKAAIIELKNALRQNANNAGARLLLGEIYFNLGAYADAEKELRRAMELGASESMGFPLLAQTLLARNELQALQELSTEQLSPDARSTVLAARGAGMLRLGEIEAATALSDQALEESSNALYPLFVRALVKLAGSAGQYDEALKQLDAVFKVAPDYAPALALLGDIKWLSGQLAAADSAYSHAIAASANNFDVRYKRALLRVKVENFEGAREDATALRTQMPQHPGTHYLLGILNYHDGNFEDAATELYTASQYEDRYPLSLFYLAIVHVKLGNLVQAEASAARYLAPEPDSVPGRKLLATIKLQTRDNAEAEQLIRPVVAANESDAEALNILATALLQQGKIQESTELFSRVAELRPDSADAQSRLGAVLIEGGEVAGGLQHFETALDMDPQLQRTDVLLVSALMKQQNYDAALDAIDTFERKNPDAIEARNMRGTVYLRAGKKAEAEQAFASVLESEPGDQIANHNLALLAIQSKDYARARTYYQNVLEQDADNLATLLSLAALSQRQLEYPAMLAFLEHAVDKHPQNVQPRVVLARYYLINGEADKVSLVVGGLDDIGRGHPDVINVQGLAQLQLGQYRDAIFSFERLSEMVPDAPQPHYHLGLAYRGLGDSEKMVAEFEKAVEISPAYVEPRIELARAMLHARNRDAAIKQLEILRELAPHHPEVVQLEAVRVRFDGDQAEALRLSEDAFEKAPTTRNLLVLARQHWLMGNRESTVRLIESWLREYPTDTVVRLEVASLFESSGREEEAITQYKAVLEHDTDNVVALNNLAWLLREVDPVQALGYAQSAVEIQPESSSVLDTLAVLQLENNEPEKARRSIELALSKNSSDPGSRYHSAMIYVAVGDSDGAIKTLKALLEEGQDFPQRGEAQKLLDELQ